MKMFVARVMNSRHWKLTRIAEHLSTVCILMLLIAYCIFAGLFHQVHSEDNFEDLFQEPSKLSYAKTSTSLAKKTRLDVYKNPSSAWERFQNDITKNQLYNPADPTVEQLERDMSTFEITSVEQLRNGTQFKLIVTFGNGAKAIFKPMRFDREHSITGKNQFYFTDFERHNAEIAAYHLDRVLGFYRVPPTVGRVISIKKDIQQHVKDPKLYETIYESPAGNMCFYGQCKQYCNAGLAFCGNPDEIEGSLQTIIPFKGGVQKTSPWKRSYRKTGKADWENDPLFCDKRKNMLDTRYLLDITDMSFFDFLQGNMDRHSFNLYTKQFRKEAFPIAIDNGRAFGRFDIDDESILAPVIQCCVFRYSTLRKLLKWQTGPARLSDAFYQSTKKDPVFPLVVSGFVKALDRRLNITLTVIRKCVKLKQFSNVIFDDGH